MYLILHACEWQSIWEGCKGSGKIAKDLGRLQKIWEGCKGSQPYKGSEMVGKAFRKVAKGLGRLQMILEGCK